MAQTTRRVAVTGASGYLGRLLVNRLVRCEEVERVLAIDNHPMLRQPPPSVDFVNRDTTRDISDLLIRHRVDCVAHLAFVIRPDRNRERARKVNVEGAANVLDGCAAAGVEQVLYMSSATVYGAHPDNPPALTERAPLRPVAGFQYAEAKVEVEELLREFGRRHRDASVCVLRACPVLGPDADNFVARNLARRVLVGVAGYDPPMQFLHEDDVSDIMTHCLMNRVDGIYNVGGRDTLRMSEMARVAGSKLLRLPAHLLYGVTELSWLLRMQGNTPACGLDFIRYPWVVSGERLEREHGLRAERSSEQAWESFVSRNSDRG